MRVEAVATVLALGMLAHGAFADGPPWRARRVRGMRPNLIANARVEAVVWPAEPPSPRQVDPETLASALRQICGAMRPRTAMRYATWILEYAGEFDVDPFLLGALAYRRSHCLRDHVGEHGEIGLTGIPRALYGRALRGGVYRYRVREGSRWVERTLDVARFPFNGPRLELAQSNLYFAAALLRGWREQHPHLDEAFPQVTHRHAVSHFV